MWRLGFFFHEMAFGLLSVFLPLYVISIHGSLLDIGIMTSVALFLAIPASFFWGYICDKTRRYKRYILISFLASTVILYLFTLSTSVTVLILLYAAMSILHIAHEPPKNVLIAELYSRKDWERSFAFYEGLTEVGWLIGLVLGFFASTYGVSQVDTLLLCSALNLVAFVASVALVADPLLIFERGLVSIEKSVDFAYRGVSLASRAWDGVWTNDSLRRENVVAFGGGLVLFSLATSLLFTPMPVFIDSIATAAALPSGIVFAIFVLNSGGAVAGYFWTRNRSNSEASKRNLTKVVLLRSFLAFLLIGFAATTYTVALSTIILILLGFAYALFLVYTLSLSMELIPAGKAGLFNVLVGIGSAGGSFVGPVLAQIMGFEYVFVTAGLIFFAAYVSFKVFS
ncbi:MAG TPA: MFS transporter [Candidatus Acidoferrum sp.]|jgi:MFS family permease|nr:MFS transporter [Candidatus Acidoferrum sp.]